MLNREEAISESEETDAESMEADAEWDLKMKLIRLRTFVEVKNLIADDY